MSDKSEAIASIFERTAGLFDKRGTGFVIGAALAKMVATLIRTIGIADTQKAIQDLLDRKTEGVITDAHIARDDREITDAVADMYRDEDPEDEDPKPEE